MSKVNVWEVLVFFSIACGKGVVMGCPLPSTTLLLVLCPMWAQLTLSLPEPVSDSGTLVKHPGTSKVRLLRLPGDAVGLNCSLLTSLDDSKPTAG